MPDELTSNIDSRNTLIGLTNPFYLGIFSPAYLNYISAISQGIPKNWTFESGVYKYPGLFENNKIHFPYAGWRKNRGNDTRIDATEPLTKEQKYAIGGASIDIGRNLLNGIFGPKQGYDSKYSDVTLALDSSYDTASDMMMSVNPMIGTIMKGAGLFGDALNHLGGGTDGMTGIDAAFNSAPLTALTLGMNGWGGKKSDTFAADTTALEQVGASYGGTSMAISDALDKLGKKYGLFSSGARHAANTQIANAKLQQATMGDIADTASNAFAIQGSMSAINSNARALSLQGGYNQSSVHVGKQGMKIPKHASGASLDDTVNTPMAFRETVELAIEEKISPTSIDVTNDTIQPWLTKYTNNSGVDSETVYGPVKETLTIKDAADKFGIDQNNVLMYYVTHPEIQAQYTLRHNPVTQEYELVSKATDINTPVTSTKSTTTSTTEDESTQTLQKGGKVNVIPEGALHARLNNMDVENITRKGIPVISKDEDGGVIQHAEIERGELILRLEVTEKLENLYKEYEDASKSELDDIAFEAGNLLVTEIINNTLDNTNNLI